MTDISYALYINELGSELQTPFFFLVIFNWEGGIYLIN